MKLTMTQLAAGFGMPVAADKAKEKIGPSARRYRKWKAKTAKPGTRRRKR